MYLYSYLSTQGRHIWTGSTRRLSAIEGAPEDDDQVNSLRHPEAMIERLWRCNRRPRLSELRDAPGGHARAGWEMHFEAVIERVGYAIGGHDRANLEAIIG